MAMIDRYAGASGSDVARFLGRADDQALAEMADLHANIQPRASWLVGRWACR